VAQERTPSEAELGRGGGAALKRSAQPAARWEQAAMEMVGPLL